MSKKFKTKNQEKYIYFSVDGSQITLEPGKNGVTAEMIATLHAFEEQERNGDRREDYGSPVRVGKQSDDEYQNLEDKNPRLADYHADPLEMLMKTVLEQEHSEQLSLLTKALDSLTALQKQTVYKKFYLNMSEVAIALEEGVDRSAVCHRLESAYKKLSKKLKKL